MGDTKAVFWIATDRYLAEAQQSMDSVAEFMPGLAPLLLMPGKNLPPRQHSLWYLDFVGYMNEALKLGYEQMLFLDTDTYMCAPVYEIFDILDRFDIVSTIAPARIISPTVNPIPPTFAEYNTGVLAFNNNESIRRLFVIWYDLYKNNADTYSENDQAALREAMWQWPGRPYVLPPEYNCRFGFGGQAAGIIKILHGRSNNMAALAENINRDTGIRGWRRGDFS